MGYSPWGRKESDTTERLLLTSFDPSPCFAWFWVRVWLTSGTSHVCVSLSQGGFWRSGLQVVDITYFG